MAIACATRVVEPRRRQCPCPAATTIWSRPRRTSPAAKSPESKGSAKPQAGSASLLGTIARLALLLVGTRHRIVAIALDILFHLDIVHTSSSGNRVTLIDAWQSAPFPGSGRRLTAINNFAPRRARRHERAMGRDAKADAG